MKKTGILRRTAVLLAIAISIVFSACAGIAPDVPNEERLPYWTGVEGEYMDISQNLSAYGTREQDYSTEYFPAQFFVDAERKTEVVGPASNNTWKLWVPKGTTDIYVVPPQIALLTETGEQQIFLDQDYPIQANGFSVVSITIPELDGSNPYENKIHIKLFLNSENNQYPEKPNLIYNGKRYRLSSWSAKRDEENNLVHFSHSCEMPDLYTASMAMKYGFLQYEKLQTIVPADKAVYTCREGNINIHLVSQEDTGNN